MNLPGLLFVSWSVLPSQMANAVQVVRNCNALVATGAVNVVLIARRRPGDRRPEGEIAIECGLDERVGLILLPSSKVLAGLQILHLAKRRELAGRRIDHVYSRVLPIFLRRLGRGRRIFEMHEPPRANWRMKPRIFELVLRRGGITDIVFISGSLARIVREEHEAALSASAACMHILHSGGPGPGPPVGEPGGPFTVAYAGRRDKLDTRIVAALAEHDPDIVIRIFGRRSEAADPLAEYPNVDFAGWVDPGSLTAALAGAHALIAPYAAIDSAQWFSPVKIFDYAASGRPILISDSASAREVIEMGKRFWLLPPDDPRPWCQVIDQLKSDPGLRAEASGAALRLAAEYSMENRANQILKFLSPSSNK